MVILGLRYLQGYTLLSSYSKDDAITHHFPAMIFCFPLIHFYETAVNYVNGYTSYESNEKNFCELLTNPGCKLQSRITKEYFIKAKRPPVAGLAGFLR